MFPPNQTTIGNIFQKFFHCLIFFLYNFSQSSAFKINIRCWKLFWFSLTFRINPNKFPQPKTTFSWVICSISKRKEKDNQPLWLKLPNRRSLFWLVWVCFYRSDGGFSNQWRMFRMIFFERRFDCKFLKECKVEGIISGTAQEILDNHVLRCSVVCGRRKITWYRESCFGWVNKLPNSICPISLSDWRFDESLRSFRVLKSFGWSWIALFCVIRSISSVWFQSHRNWKSDDHFRHQFAFGAIPPLISHDIITFQYVHTVRIKIFLCSTSDFLEIQCYIDQVQA
jgi:hypothetical protein